VSGPKLTPEEEAEYRSATSKTGVAGKGSVHSKLSPEEEAEYRAKAKPVASEPEKPSTGRAVAEGALQGGSYGFGDELQGVIGAVLKRSPGLGYPSAEEQGEENIFSPSGYGGTFMEDYERERNAARTARDASEKAHPTAFNTSQIAAALLAPGPKAGGTAKGFAKASAKAGGAFGLGSSDADLTKGDVGGAALDTGLGLGLGGLLGAAGGVAARPLQYGARKMTEFGQRAFARGAEKAQKPIDAAINSTRGALGGEVAAGSRGIEMAEKAAVNPRLSEDISRAASDALSDAEVQALEERVARSQIGGLYGRLPRIEKAQTAFDAAQDAGAPELRKAATDAFMDQSPMKRAMWEIAKRIAPTMVGAGVGGSLGGTAGAGVGGTLGLLAGAMSGRPGRIVSNAIRSPQFQRSAAQLGERVLGEAAPGAIQGATAEQAGSHQSKLRETLAPYLDFLHPREPEK
jgi:hypothetical protein